MSISSKCRTICWTPIWNKDREGVGLEHLLLSERTADSVILAFDEERGPIRLAYHLHWDELWRVRDAELNVKSDETQLSLSLRSDGRGHWCHKEGQAIEALNGCIDIDIWPTPFTNMLPIRREKLIIGERRLFLMAWVSLPDLGVCPQRQSYTRLDEQRYLFESLDGSGFSAELNLDDDGVVLDYPGLFRRVRDDR